MMRAWYKLSLIVIGLLSSACKYTNSIHGIYYNLDEWPYVIDLREIDTLKILKNPFDIIPNIPQKIKDSESNTYSVVGKYTYSVDGEYITFSSTEKPLERILKKTRIKSFDKILPSDSTDIRLVFNSPQPPFCYFDLTLFSDSIHKRTYYWEKGKSLSVELPSGTKAISFSIRPKRYYTAPWGAKYWGLVETQYPDTIDCQDKRLIFIDLPRIYYTDYDKWFFFGSTMRLHNGTLYWDGMNLHKMTEKELMELTKKSVIKERY